MKTTNAAAGGAGGLTENLKKGATEMLVLSLLAVRPMTIHEILRFLDELSGGVCRISYPYAIIYRLSNSGFIRDSGKQVSDRRLRVYYEITEEGMARRQQMLAEYRTFTAAVDTLLQSLSNEWKKEEKKE